MCAKNPARDDHDVRHDAPPQHQPFWSPRLLRSLSKRLSNTVFFLVSLRRRKSETNYRLGRPAVNRRVAKTRLNHQLVHHHQLSAATNQRLVFVCVNQSEMSIYLLLTRCSSVVKGGPGSAPSKRYG